MRLPAGWLELDADESASLRAELLRELPASHELKGLALEAVARRSGQDDVLFRSDTGGVFCVHLTWSVESDPEWPWTESYRDLDDFVERWTSDEESDPGVENQTETANARTDTIARWAKYAVVAGIVVVGATYTAIVLSYSAAFAVMPRQDLSPDDKARALAEAIEQGITYRRLGSLTYPLGGLLILWGGGTLVTIWLQRRPR